MTPEERDLPHSGMRGRIVRSQIWWLARSDRGAVIKTLQKVKAMHGGGDGYRIETSWHSVFCLLMWSQWICWMDEVMERATAEKNNDNHKCDQPLGVRQQLRKHMIQTRITLYIELAGWHPVKLRGRNYKAAGGQKTVKTVTENWSRYNTDACECNWLWYTRTQVFL